MYVYACICDISKKIGKKWKLKAVEKAVGEGGGVGWYVNLLSAISYFFESKCQEHPQFGDGVLNVHPTISKSVRTEASTHRL